MTCCENPITIAYRSHFSADGHCKTLVRLQCNVCGKRTRWCEWAEEAVIDWRRENDRRRKSAADGQAV